MANTLSTQQEVCSESRDLRVQNRDPPLAPLSNIAAVLAGFQTGVDNVAKDTRLTKDNTQVKQQQA